MILLKSNLLNDVNNKPVVVEFEFVRNDGEIKPDIVFDSAVQKT